MLFYFFLFFFNFFVTKWKKFYEKKIIFFSFIIWWWWGRVYLDLLVAFVVDPSPDMLILRSRKRRNRWVAQAVWCRYRTQSNWVCSTVDFYLLVSNFFLVKILNPIILSQFPREVNGKSDFLPFSEKIWKIILHTWTEKGVKTGHVKSFMKQKTFFLLSQ